MALRPEMVTEINRQVESIQLETLNLLKSKAAAETIKLAKRMEASLRKETEEARRRIEILSSIAAFNSQLEADPESKKGLGMAIDGHLRRKAYFSYTKPFSGVIISASDSEAAMLTKDGIRCFRFTAPYNSLVDGVWQELEAAETMPFEKADIKRVFIPSSFPSAEIVTRAVEILISMPTQEK